jgi:hypothetical protein
MKLWGIGQISPSEKNDILSKHKELYNGYRAVYPEVSNTQPLYVQDFANDKGGITVNNKGQVKSYTNFGINESTEASKMCSECGGMMYEGECSECGYKMEDEMDEGECSECGYKMEDEMDEETMTKSLEEYLKKEIEEEEGKLSDIYNVEDLNPSDEFDYVKGATNKTNAFHVKEHQLIQTPIGRISSVGKMEEQGGNADDMDVSDVKDPYNFVSNGPNDGGDTYPVNEDDDEVIYEIEFDELTQYDTDLEDKSDNLEQEGYEHMESAWNSEIDEVDVSGSQGIYGDMDPAYDFDSEGPGKGGPYQEFHGETISSDEDDDYEDEYDPTDKSWEEITAHTGGDEFGYVDEDIRESLVIQKNRIMEMMNRMKVIK